LPLSTICHYFHVDADLVRRNYKKFWSNYENREKKSHCQQHLVYPGNISESIAIDQLTLSKGELYTYITSKDNLQRNGTKIASNRGTKSENIIRSGELIPESERKKVKEVSLDMAANMKLTAREYSLLISEWFPTQPSSCLDSK